VSEKFRFELNLQCSFRNSRRNVLPYSREACRRRGRRSAEQSDFELILTPPGVRKLFANAHDVALIGAHSTQLRA